MNNIQIKVKKLKEGAVMPTGSDLYACIDSPIVIAPHETVMIGTGLAMEIPAGYAGLIYPRSGIASRRGLAPANKVGVVDPDYRGEFMVAMHNHSEAPATIEPGERIVQSSHLFSRRTLRRRTNSPILFAAKADSVPPVFIKIKMPECD
mgnify:CR=1 FL=1